MPEIGLMQFSQLGDVKDEASAEIVSKKKRKKKRKSEADAAVISKLAGEEDDEDNESPPKRQKREVWYGVYGTTGFPSIAS